MGEYDRIPAPRKRCQNCKHGTVFVTDYGDRWDDVYRCAIDQGLKDYRVTCGAYEQKAEQQK